MFKSFKHQYNATLSKAMTNVILQWLLTSASVRFQNCDFDVSYNTIFSIGYKGKVWILYILCWFIGYVVTFFILSEINAF